MFQVRYLSIRYQGAKGPQIAAVRSYRSGDVGKKELASQAYNDLLRYLQKTGKYKEATHDLHAGILPGEKLRGAFNGKASAETCADVLRLVDHYIANADMPYQKFGWSHKNVSVQDYADWYLGLDCNGFVGQYFQYNYAGLSSIGPSTSCNDFDSWGHHGEKRSSLEEIRPLDVLVREGGSGTRHVALVESIQTAGSKTATIRLVHSAHSKGGLTSDYVDVSWLGKPGSKSEAKSVMSVRVNGYLDFSYAIGYPWTKS